MLNTAKRIIAALAIALMATAGTVGPAHAGTDKPSGIGGGWCC